jgi:hypothetical protein
MSTNTPPSELKPKMLCWIKHSIRPENLGLIVETSQYLGYFKKGESMLIMGEHYFAYDSDHFWFITSKHGMISTQFGKSTVGYSSESWLVPILPDTDKLGLTNAANDDWLLTSKVNEKETENV